MLCYIISLIHVMRARQVPMLKRPTLKAVTSKLNLTAKCHCIVDFNSFNYTTRFQKIKMKIRVIA